jgi:hypothetical protein
MEPVREIEESAEGEQEEEPGSELPGPDLTPFEVSGVVVDDEGTPLEGAFVMQGGRAEEAVQTDSEGVFSIVLQNSPETYAALVAAKMGYRAAGMEYFPPGEAVTLRLRKVRAPDNEDYIYQDPGDGVNVHKEDCTHCHGSFVSQFLTSKHAEAAKNVLLQDLYAGISQAFSSEESCESSGGVWAAGKVPGQPEAEVEKCYIGGGVLGDLNSQCGGEGQPRCDALDISEDERPSTFGGCADCHAPGIDGKAGGRDLHEAHGLAYEKGVHCDVCHKVRDVDLSKPPGVGQRLVMGRPGEPGRNIFVWDPVYYGPLKDVPNIAMGGSYQPKFEESLFCAGCHEQEQEALLPGESVDHGRWPKGVPVHSTYSEWKAGPYNQSETPCQFCHMPATVDPKVINPVDLARRNNQSITFGFERPPEDIRQHIFRGPLDGSPRLIDGAVYVSLRTSRVGSELEVTASVANSGCGHAVPTGEPMRALVMVVEASSDECGILSAQDGMTIGDVGGALATGVVGESISVVGTRLTWGEGAARANPGDVVRGVRPTGSFDDYDGVGFFGNESLSAKEKGMEIRAPVGEARVASVGSGAIELDSAVGLLEGDEVFLGAPWPGAQVDGEDALHLAGKPGYTFSRVLVDSAGRRNVPHYRAVDMRSDNRIPPGGRGLTVHRFEVPSGCESGEVRAEILYRPVPLQMAATRGWSAKDYVIARGQASFR